MPVTILGIESSCDETSAAVLIDGQIVSNITADQSVHAKYGGVVPELASRAHQANIIPVVSATLRDANIDLKKLNAVAFTQGPGLLGALMVGTSYAKGLALALDIPLIAVHHMQAHILAHFIKYPHPQFPFLCLTVSGGHTQIVLAQDHLQMKVIGQTIDDAAGEAFDKTAKMLGLNYPGGPLIDKYAKQGNGDKFHFPEPQVPDLNFSFSGLKTSILYFLRDEIRKNENFIQENLYDLCASIQKTIAGILLKKMIKAAKHTGIREIAISGGVSANSELRRLFTENAKELGWNIYIPDLEYCTDNAAMIAITGYYKYLKKEFAEQTIIPLARIPELKSH
ncbi:MAG: tRNA (adenosine(37)-N6)-threonylcarbamoyltransferase complex transferase subunit TsaD [Fimbriimonadaceae bacterium]|nr:tRNA (adenosine(37)-N6)-threonylcarbamoyltransferase complex transferase subunit TsaD [Chitinophagales bacterium]